MTCTECKEARAEESLPYVVHEAEMARAERNLTKLWITVLLLIAVLVASNAAWIWYESQFETVTTTQEVTQDAENGTNSFVGGDLIGETNGTDDNDNPQA